MACVSSTLKDTIFRLNTRRKSYKGFEFGDSGFITTDFDQLSRGHTQLISIAYNFIFMVNIS